MYLFDFMMVIKYRLEKQLANNFGDKVHNVAAVPAQTANSIEYSQEDLPVTLDALCATHWGLDVTHKCLGRLAISYPLLV